MFTKNRSLGDLVFMSTQKKLCVWKSQKNFAFKIFQCVFNGVYWAFAIYLCLTVENKSKNEEILLIKVKGKCIIKSLEGKKFECEAFEWSPIRLVFAFEFLFSLHLTFWIGNSFSFFVSLFFFRYYFCVEPSTGITWFFSFRLSIINGAWPKYT